MPNSDEPDIHVTTKHTAAHMSYAYLYTTYLNIFIRIHLVSHKSRKIAAVLFFWGLAEIHEPQQRGLKHNTHSLSSALTCRVLGTLTSSAFTI